MTPVGHCLTGLSFAALVVPRNWDRRQKAVAFAAFILVANAPDLSIAFRSHYAYRVGHSLFVNLALVVAVVGMLISSRGRRSEGAWRWVVAGGAAAWLSHLLLDSFYSHGYGVRIFWPLGDAALSLPVPWFHVLPRDSLIQPTTLQILVTEAVCYGALLGACVIFRRCWKAA